MNELKVNDVMTHLVVTLRRGDSIQEAARRLLSNRISGAPVVEEGRLIGIVSEADLFGAFAEPPRRKVTFAATTPLLFLIRGLPSRLVTGVTVEDVMTTDAITVTAEESIWKAAALFDNHGIRRLPVIDEDRHVVGILSRADLVRAMARSDEDIAGSVRDAVLVLGEESFSELDVEVSEGSVTILGTADRRSTHDIAVRIASQVPGVLRVLDELGWDQDDSHAKPVSNRRDPYEVQRDPWAAGPLVKGDV